MTSLISYAPAFLFWGSHITGWYDPRPLKVENFTGHASTKMQKKKKKKKKRIAIFSRGNPLPEQVLTGNCRSIRGTKKTNISEGQMVMEWNIQRTSGKSQKAHHERCVHEIL